MPKTLPALRERAWVSLFPQLLVLALFVSASHLLVGPPYFAFSLAMGAAVYLLYSQTIRRLATKNLRRGFKLLKGARYQEAIEEYDKAYRFFSRHAWLDRYRYLALLSSSAYGYREMALCNIAFAYGQMGDGERALQWYRRALSEFPDCALARTSLQGADALGTVADGRGQAPPLRPDDR